MESGNVFEMVKSRFGNRFDVGLEEEDGVEGYSQFADLREGRDGGTFNVEEQIPNLPEQCLGGHNHELCLVAVKIKAWITSNLLNLRRHLTRD